MLLSQCSWFLFALSAFLCEDVHECGNGDVSAAAAATVVEERVWKSSCLSTVQCNYLQKLRKLIGIDVG